MSVLLRAVALAAALAAAGAVHADAQAGRSKAQACFACHGEDGNATQAGVPSLAAQPRQFIVSALFQFREGKRSNAVMEAMASPLSNADLNDLADYFSGQKRKAPAASVTPEQAAAAREITQRNNCGACHTATFVGQQHIPRLAGQQRDYLVTQLSAFHAGTRGELDGVMTSAAQALSPQDIELLASYLASLSPDKP